MSSGSPCTWGEVPGLNERLEPEDVAVLPRAARHSPGRMGATHSPSQAVDLDPGVYPRVLLFGLLTNLQTASYLAIIRPTQLVALPVALEHAAKITIWVL